MLRKIYLFLVLSLAYSYSLALTPLPPNSFLRLGDHSKAVQILQRILNYDVETQVAASGPGSPGKETWYFGKSTEDALIRFQRKHGLEPTGRIDYETYLAIEEFVASVVLGDSDPLRSGLKSADGKMKNKIEEADKLRKAINEQNKKDFEEIKKKTKKEFEEMNDLAENPELPTDPLRERPAPLSPADQEKQNPKASQPHTPTQGFGPTSPLPLYSPPEPEPPQPSPLSRLLPFLAAQHAAQQAAQQAAQNQGQQGPFQQDGFVPPPTLGFERNAGQITGQVGRIGQCRATTFAHSTAREGCVADRGDQVYGNRPASFSRFGIYLSRPGVPAIPAVASWAGSFGDAVEIKDMRTGRCKAFPLMDRGPGRGPLSRGVCIDLTGSAVDILEGQQPCGTVGGLGTLRYSIGPVQYAFVPGEQIQPGQTKDCKHLAR